MRNIIQLTEELSFPPVKMSRYDGLLCFGGDLSFQRLLLAYRNGIFPWYSSGDPILWWSPDPRFVMTPDDLIVSKSMKKVLSKNIFTVKLDTSFREVILNCGNLRAKDGTWITKEIIDGYCELHNKGYAHSVEVYYEDKLVGGLYGVSIGSVFFGESMFHLMDNASKTGFIILVKLLKENNIHIIDCQIHSKHLESLGAYHISRDNFIEVINKCVNSESHVYNWNIWLKDRKTADFI